MYSDVEKAFDNGMRYAWNMVGDLFNMTPTERIDALGYSEVNEIVWDCDPLEVKQKLLDWKSKTDDIVKVVRCKDCKYSEYDGVFRAYWCKGKRVIADHYCGYGELRHGKDQQ